IMPAGLLAMADLLKKTGNSVQVVHAGMETALQPKNGIENILESFEPDIIAISMHWHHQMAAVRDVINKAKKISSGSRIILGGMTASFFYREIMHEWNNVDFVIRGDGELPLLALAKALDGSGDFSGVPNFSYRKDGQTRHNGLTYQADDAMLNRLDFSNLALMRRPNTYGGLYGGAIGRSNSKMEPEDTRKSEKDGYFYLCCGRGCSAGCAWCAGSTVSHMRMHGRRKPIFRHASRIADDIQKAASHGYHRFYICFDPPGQSSPYMDMMRTLRDRNLSVSLIFEAYGQPPDDEFVLEFSKTFRKEHSAITLSPDTSDEKLRQFYKGKAAMTNSSIEKTLARCAKHGIKTELYFALLPGQNFTGLKKSHEWAKSLSEKYGCSLVFMPVEMEPGAPWHLNPSKYDVKPLCVSFNDFLERSAARDFSHPPKDPGYLFSGFERQIDYILSEGLAARDYVTS
ncbi:MAG TPA: cobalamin-dependent protein, partial [bacterium]|nr:cobalamin-dependent protein [bacterium]